MKTKNIPLIVAILLPIIFIIIISAVIFLPSLFIKPQHNFIYTTEDNYYDYNQGYRNTYAVINEKVALQPLPPQKNEIQTKEAPVLYLYDIATNSSHQITFQEAQNYSVDPGPSSIDGYTVTYNYGYGDIFDLFGSRGDQNGYFVSKGNGKKRLNGLPSDRYGYQRGFKFIGWIK